MVIGEMDNNRRNNKNMKAPPLPSIFIEESKCSKILVNTHAKCYKDLHDRMASVKNYPVFMSNIFECEISGLSVRVGMIFSGVFILVKRLSDLHKLYRNL